MLRASVVLLAFQLAGALVALARLSRWRGRPAALQPLRGAAPPPAPHNATTIVVATLNEAARIAPLLGALREQRAPVVEIIFVDGHSTDGTREMVEACARDDARMRFILEPPLPDGWIGKAWALECARKVARGEWLLGLDADTTPGPSLAASVVAAAERGGLDAASLAPRFAGQSPLERWLQPSLLVTLLLRAAPTGSARNGRVLANGQCFLVKRRLLEQHGGYTPVRASFAEDVSLMRHLAARGARVAFLDGSQLYSVQAYASAGQMWREWGRSIDLKDATTRAGQALDVAMLVAVQGLPVFVLAAAAAGAFRDMPWLIALNAGVFAVRNILSVALRHNYAERGISYWLSPFSDPLAAVRILISSLTRPAVWRGRAY